MKNLALVLIGLGLVITLMYVFVYEPDTELQAWCKNFKQKDDRSIGEPLMQTIRETCK